ncbi:MAG: hypothetical protein A2958_02690 [Candidatus Levybacteria bacterium RIFCSPLOWO2_01_FULL_38_13]|nr:MAG: hypothetical protein A2629_03110 [Candidatus Levybacteria bacterium RIFCSPHIGHO2_01_FULL_41_15]OGH35244.1 MAG: hypothetical protein A2958_02690 [Candidatus Levybacteria bacterium RIFCSPLOWO2_01_FULL_38_13]
MSIFNSLGSNYDFNFVLKSLFSHDLRNELIKFLEKKYQGEAILLFKGRQAITLALKLSNLPPNSLVAINGLTCYAVYDGIKKAGYETEYIDLPLGKLNFDAANLRKKIQKNPNIKAVIVQNTLGYPCDIENISKLCKEESIILIEDLAHSIGTIYKNGREAGTVGDFTVLSFSQDKIVDGVSGGALIIRHKKFQKTLQSFKNPPFYKQLTDTLYPLLTFVIRKTYDLRLGKIIHFVLRKTNLLSVPMDRTNYSLLSLPGFYSGLILKSFKNLGGDLNHRRKISEIYSKNLNSQILSKEIANNTRKSSSLRFPIFIEKRDELIKILKREGFYLSDIWYDYPIAPKKFAKLTNYKGDCSRAEKISGKIFNLPTHRNISEIQALYLAKLINEWVK